MGDQQAYALVAKGWQAGLGHLRCVEPCRRDENGNSESEIQLHDNDFARLKEQYEFCVEAKLSPS